MSGRSIGALCGIAFVLFMAGARVGAGQAPGGYRPVKACSLVTLTEVKKIAPWPASKDQFATPEEHTTGLSSMCVYLTTQVLVGPYQQRTIDTARKGAPLTPVPGLGDEVFQMNNKNLFAVVYAHVGPHLLTVESEIPQGKTYESMKPTVIEVAKAFAAKLR